MSLLIPVCESCSFCEYLEGRRPYTILERDELTATLVTREQRGLGHLLVIPVKHRETILDLAPDEGAALMAGVTNAARLVARAYTATGVAVWQNNGTPAHQTVPHVHFHVAATLPDGGTNWGEVPRLSVAETDAIAARLRSPEHTGLA
ncbi:MAG: HIT domain-containing protein [Sporichthyaceae bacterium]|nr:HIT domain-containing protein [Sporichthyaceae bacterium]